ncbi:malate dehydrogenase, mitochondrial-like [Thrips palmi]|uniref:Malate dehydrogenase, mitochondrial n=1 Tax=Thrips palmi TaxID=161013 RepID=A0A6P8Z593_THRPL|nr:malate dehydrogenase, mitochondrial-like [Thrips palmi]
MRERTGCDRPVKVAVVGASSRAGWTAAFLLKSSRLLSQVRLHDWQSRASLTCPATRALATELEHINTACSVSSHAGSRELRTALTGADVVLLCSDSSTVTSEEEAFNRGCSTAREVAMATADFCPEAVLVVGAEPVNSLVPLMAETHAWK